MRGILPLRVLTSWMTGRLDRERWGERTLDGPPLKTTEGCGLRFLLGLIAPFVRIFRLRWLEAEAGRGISSREPLRDPGALERPGARRE